MTDKAPPEWFGETRNKPTDNGNFEGLGDIKPRCANLVNGRPCHRLLAEFVTRPWEIRCTRCKHLNVKR